MHPANMDDLGSKSGFTSLNPLSIPSAPTPAPAPASAGTKRKRDTQPKFYAVRVGKEPGVYHTWLECLDQVRGFPKSVFKSFPSMTEAQAFIAGERDLTNGVDAAGKLGTPQKWYGVRSGRIPGVYTSWEGVLDQIRGWKGPKHKMFKTRAEAELFVKEGAHGMNGHGSAMESIETNGGMPNKKKAKITIKPDPDLHEHIDYLPGEAPLDGAEDDFDATITLSHTDPATSLRFKTDKERSRTTYSVARPARLAPIRIYTDGSSLANGRAEAMAGVGVYFGPGDGRNVSEGLQGTKQTNQRAELTAVLRALEACPKDRRVVILTDSRYAINCCSDWFKKWRANGWVNAAGKSVENRDLIQKVVDNLEERMRMNEHRHVESDEEDEADDGEINGVAQNGGTKGHWERGLAGVKFVWVKGHAKDPGNEAADGLATAGARGARELVEAYDETF